MDGGDGITALTRYEVAKISKKATAMAVYAFQVRDPALAENAATLQEIATLRIGELMEGDRQSGLMAKAGRPKIGSAKDPISEDVPTLASQGVDKHLADAARKAAAKTKEQFDADLKKKVRRVVAAAKGDKAVVKESKADLKAEKNAARKVRESALAGKILALPNKKYGVILADPEWQFKVYSEKTGGDVIADNYYATSELDAIKKRDVRSIAAADCFLFLWATSPMMPQALLVMGA